MLIVRPLCGLCNRMRVIASATTMAHECGSEAVILWKKDGGLNCRFDDIFVKNSEIKVIELPKFPKRSPMSYICRLSFARRCYYNLKKNDLPEIEKIKADIMKGKNVYIATCEQFYDDNGFSMFQFSDYIEHKVSHIMKFSGGGYGRYTY